jgi:hypothetical protein
MRLIEAFPSSFVVDITPGWPGTGEQVKSFISYQQLGMHTEEFQEIRFYPKIGESWIGRFEKGERDKFEDAIFSVPAPSSACVISSGAGFWVDVETKEATSLECPPITGAFASSRHELILVVTWTDLYAYRSASVAWSLRKIAYDRLHVTQIDEDELTAVGFDGGSIEIKVDIPSGKLMSSRRIE